MCIVYKRHYLTLILVMSCLYPTPHSSHILVLAQRDTSSVILNRLHQNTTKTYAFIIQVTQTNTQFLPVYVHKNRICTNIGIIYTGCVGINKSKKFIVLVETI